MSLLLFYVIGGLLSGVMGQTPLPPVNGGVLAEATPTQPSIVSYQQQEVEAIDDRIDWSARLGDRSYYRDLPVASVSVSSTVDAKGTIVLLPQHHKYPGSEVQSKKNDRAVKAQDDLEDILDQVAEDVPSPIVFLEGELVGAVDTEKITRYNQVASLHDQFMSDTEKLDGLMEAHAFPERIQEKADSVFDKAGEGQQRRLLLAGAPFAVQYERENVKLFGTENQATLDESAALVRNYLYVQDRLAQVGGPNKLAQRTIRPEASLSLNEALKLLNARTPVDTFGQTMAEIKQLATKRQLSDVVAVATEIEQTASTVSTAPIEVSKKKTSLPSRDQNPFADIRDEQKLRQLQQTYEEEINTLVLHRRNVETAEAVSQTLKTEGGDVAFLQFGAAHTEGLRAELMKQGYDVVTVVADSVSEEK